MNLNNNPTKEELKALLQKQNDAEGNHMLWVDHSGGVHIDLILEETGSGWEKRMESKFTFRYETYSAGYGYVGEEAASDESHVSNLFEELITDWQIGRRGFIDIRSSLFKK